MLSPPNPLFLYLARLFLSASTVFSRHFHCFTHSFFRVLLLLHFSLHLSLFFLSVSLSHSLSYIFFPHFHSLICYSLVSFSFLYNLFHPPIFLSPIELPSFSQLGNKQTMDLRFHAQVAAACLTEEINKQINQCALWLHTQL